MDADNGIAMEGYLFKRASNAFKTWNRYDGTTSNCTSKDILKINFEIRCGFSDVIGVMTNMWCNLEINYS